MLDIFVKLTISQRSLEWLNVSYKSLTFHVRSLFTPLHPDSPVTCRQRPDTCLVFHNSLASLQIWDSCLSNLQGLCSISFSPHCIDVDNSCEFWNCKYKNMSCHCVTCQQKSLASIYASSVKSALARWQRTIRLINWFAYLEISTIKNCWPFARWRRKLLTK